MLNGEWGDFVQDFLSLTEGEESPELWRKWSAIALCAGALERRVWVKAGVKIAFPNLYVTLVGRPGTGKFIIETIRDLWREATEPGTKIPTFRVAPNNMTKASLMDDLAKCKKIFLTPQGPPLIYHSMLVAAEEFGVLMPKYEQDYVASINYIWNCPRQHEETRRTGAVKFLSIEYPQLNIIAGAAPSYLAHTFPEEAWSSGLARRLIMIYAAEPPGKPLFYVPKVREGLREQLVQRLSHMSMLFGEMKWEGDHEEERHWKGAKLLMNDWDKERDRTAPTHSKLVDYVRSRRVFAQKLAMISAVARSGEKLITLADVKRGINWLLEAEKLMPDIFREMIGKSDNQVLEELHYFLTAYYAKTQKKPIHTEMIVNFLRARAPVEKVERLLMIAARAGIMAQAEGGNEELWVPRARAGDME